MKLFSYSYARRSTAFVMLALWLFALASGVANACLLEAPGTNSQPATAGAGHAGAIADRDNHDNHAGTSKAPCLKVCDEGFQALQKQESRGVDLTDPGPATLVATLWTAARPGVSVSHRMDDPPPSIAEPPLRVRYSRWAL